VWEQLAKLLGALKPFVVPFFRMLGDITKMIGQFVYNVIKIVIALLNARAIEIILYILLIVFLIWGIRKGISASRASGSGGRRGGSGVVKSWFESAQKGMQKTLRGYTQFNPDVVPKVTREEHKEGRCDDQTYIETNVNKCVFDGEPSPIEWEIRPGDLAGWSLIPKRLQDRLNEKGSREVIIIPWRFDANRNKYVPKCSDARFKNGKSAAYLIRDGPADTCRRSIPNRQKFKHHKVSAAAKRRLGTHAVYRKFLDPEKC
jgi:hypothetical protein